MTSNTQDQWAQWLLHRRFGGDLQHGRAMLKELAVWRDRILEHATITTGETVLDVGCGDGLIAFGALDRVGEEGLVIFSDISQDLIDHCRTLAEQLQMLGCCRFVRAPAEDLAPIAPGSVDVVTTRSVLIYVQAKQQALHEFFRVLKPGGRLSLIEPINRFCYPEPPRMFLGYDVTPIEEIAGKVRAVFERIHEPASSPLLNFDEWDLLTYAERAGFAEIHLELQATIKQPKPLDANAGACRPSWETLLKSSGNPPSSHAGRGHGASALPSRSRTLYRVSTCYSRHSLAVCDGLCCFWECVPLILDVLFSAPQADSPLPDEIVILHLLSRGALHAMPHA